MGDDPESREASPGTIVHRIGGGSVENLRLKSKERSLEPPGISVFVGGTAYEVANQIREAFPTATRLLAAARKVGSATVDAIREAGFDVISDPTSHFANHARLIHPDGAVGFSNENLQVLSGRFHDTPGADDAS